MSNIGYQTIPLSEYKCTGKQYERVGRQRRRARFAHVPATLTTSQWMETLAHFNWHCAYCHGNYQVIDHFIPISLGGGTTADNCVPCCHSCNTAKGAEYPDVLVLLDEDFYAVQTYLETRRRVEVGA